MTEKTGTFLVTEADPGAAVLSAVDDGQVHALSSNPGLEPGDVVEGTVAAEPPLDVTWTLAEVEERRTVEIRRIGAPPDDRAIEIATDQDVGAVERRRLDDDELHVVRVPESNTDDAAAAVAGDETTLRIAARLGASRVEVRGAAGVVSVRYLS